MQLYIVYVTPRDDTPRRHNLWAWSEAEAADQALKLARRLYGRSLRSYSVRPA